MKLSLCVLLLIGVCFTLCKAAPTDEGDTAPGDEGDTAPGDEGDTPLGDEGDTAPADEEEVAPGLKITKVCVTVTTQTYAQYNGGEPKMEEIQEVFGGPECEESTNKKKRSIEGSGDETEGSSDSNE